MQNGSGTEVSDINKFMKSFEMTQKMMKEMTNPGKNKKIGKLLKNMNLEDVDMSKFNDLK